MRRRVYKHVLRLRHTHTHARSYTRRLSYQLATRVRGGDYARGPLAPPRRERLLLIIFLLQSYILCWGATTTRAIHGRIYFLSLSLVCVYMRGRSCVPRALSASFHALMDRKLKFCVRESIHRQFAIRSRIHISTAPKACTNFTASRKCVLPQFRSLNSFYFIFILFFMLKIKNAYTGVFTLFSLSQQKKLIR